MSINAAAVFGCDQGTVASMVLATWYSIPFTDLRIRTRHVFLSSMPFHHLSVLSRIKRPKYIFSDQVLDELVVHIRAYNWSILLRLRRALILSYSATPISSQTERYWIVSCLCFDFISFLMRGGLMSLIQKQYEIQNTIYFKRFIYFRITIFLEKH